MRLERLHEWLPNGVEIYRLALDLDSGPGQVESLLSTAEHARCRRFAKRADQVRFAHTRAAAKQLIGHRIGWDPGRVRFGVSEYGKPFVDLDIVDAPLFNISHSGAYSLIALGEPLHVRALGIDIELCKDDIDTEPMIDMVFTAAEGAEVRGADHILEAFYERWVSKEAVLKAIGVGVPQHLQVVGVYPEPAGRIRIDSQIVEWNCFQGKALSAPSGYAAAFSWLPKELI